MDKSKLIKYSGSPKFSNQEMKSRIDEFRLHLDRRRSIRHFSNRQIPREIIENCIQTAATAPSGANMQPYHFVVIHNAGLKRQFREEAEKIEYDFYTHKAPMGWLEALNPLQTTWEKPFLETAPYLIIIFSKSYSIDEQKRKIKHYYVKESVGIVTGFLIVAIHHIGLASLVYTPNPNRFINRLLKRPEHEKVFCVLVVGHPAVNAEVPDIEKKSFNEIVTFL